MARRPYGTGAITELGDGKYRFRVFVPDPLGGRGRQVSKTARIPGRNAKKAVEDALREFHEQAKASHAVGADVAFDRVLDAHFAHLRRIGRSEGTLETYENRADLHIRPEIGQVKLYKLTPHVLDELYRKLNDKGLGIGSINLCHSIISGALTQAMKWGWTTKNVAKMASPPKDDRDDDEDVLTVEELATLIRAAEPDDVDMAALIAVGAITGCRRGELCGLRWSDIDWATRRIRVERQWVPRKGGQVLVPHPKGGPKGKRTVSLGTAGIEVLRRYQTHKVEELGAIVEDGWLLSYDGGTTPLRAKSVTSSCAALGERTKVDFGTHRLRKFADSELEAAGVDLKTISGRQGHSPEVMARRYLQRSDARLDAAGDVIADRVAEAMRLAALSPSSPEPADK